MATTFSSLQVGPLRYNRRIKIKESDLPKVKALVKALPLIIRGRVRDANDLNRVYWEAFTTAYFARVYDDFVIKSEGGTDSLGIKWEPLKKETLAYSKRFPENRRKSKTRGLLTPEQDKVWKYVFAKSHNQNAATTQAVKRNGKVISGETVSKENAAKMAWGAVKAMGAKTKIDAFSALPHRILVVSGKLEESIKPNSTSKDQIREIGRSRVEIGSRLIYLAELEKKRPVFPKNDQSYVESAEDVALEAVLNKLESVFG